jgi:hypothetical protein
MSEMVERVARALRDDDAAELDKIRIEANSAYKAGSLDDKALLDCRELIWFKENHGWIPSEGADIDQWFGEVRQKDEALAMIDEALK